MEIEFGDEHKVEVEIDDDDLPAQQQHSQKHKSPTVAGWVLIY